jgi:hypothetical protein
MLWRIDALMHSACKLSAAASAKEKLHSNLLVINLGKSSKGSSSTMSTFFVACISAAEPHRFYAALAPDENFAAAPCLSSHLETSEPEPHRVTAPFPVLPQ